MNNFDQWVTANFQLTNDQASYLSSMSASVKGKIGDFTSDAVRWRLPIDSGKEGSGPITSKRFRLSCDFQIESFPGQPDVTTGGLHFVSDYRM